MIQDPFEKEVNICACTYWTMMADLGLEKYEPKGNSKAEQTAEFEVAAKGNEGRIQWNGSNILVPVRKSVASMPYNRIVEYG